MADGDVHFMTFEDVLSVLPKSWFVEQARAHQAHVIHSLARAVHAACYLGIGIKSIQVAPILSEKFTESGDYKMCCKAPDYSEWLKAMIKEIKELELEIIIDSPLGFPINNIISQRDGENALMESCQVVLDKDATTLKVFFLPPVLILLFDLS